MDGHASGTSSESFALAVLHEPVRDRTLCDARACSDGDHARHRRVKESEANSEAEADPENGGLHGNELDGCPALRSHRRSFFPLTRVVQTEPATRSHPPAVQGIENRSAASARAASPGRGPVAARTGWGRGRPGVAVGVTGFAHHGRLARGPGRGRRGRRCVCASSVERGGELPVSLAGGTRRH